MSEHENAMEIAEAITAASERLAAQLVALAAITERIAIALERLAGQADS